MFGRQNGLDAINASQLVQEYARTQRARDEQILCIDARNLATCTSTTGVGFIPQWSSERFHNEERNKQPLKYKTRNHVTTDNTLEATKPSVGTVRIPPDLPQLHPVSKRKRVPCVLVDLIQPIKI